MKIDRTRFLVLTGALSAAACVVVEHPAVPPTPPAAPPPAHTAAAQPPAHVVVHGVPAPAPAPATAANGGHGIVVHVPAAPATPGAGPTPPPPSPTPQPATACLDSGATTTPACSISCASNAFMAQRCAAYAANFDAKVGAAAITCMNGLTGAAACDSTQAYGCGKTALSQACPDPNTVTQLCQIAATPCKVAANDCATMISGLNSTGQDAVAQCIAKGCSAGLYSCIEGLSASASAGH